ncbi:MAG: T9SS type A sorting domain-containing protein [Bacteroidota bacterium]
MKNFLLLCVCSLLLVSLKAQPAPPEFDFPVCFTVGNIMTYRVFISDIGPSGMEESPEAGVDWVAAIDEDGYVVGLEQVISINGAFGCPNSPGVAIDIAGFDNNPTIDVCPPAPYGVETGETFDLVIYDVSRDAFYEVANNIPFVNGTSGASTGNCETVAFTVPYVVPLNPLPVVLTNFRGEATDRKTVSLAWATSAEENSDYFEVEHSADGAAWRAIGRITAAGNSTEVQNYRFEDQSPVNGQNLYRLRQVDVDGSYFFSNVISVNLEDDKGGKDVDIFPNPVIEGQFTASFAGDWGADAVSTLYDINGRQIASWSNLAKGSNVLNLPNVPAGIYQFVVADALNTKTVRMIVR